MSNYPKFKAAAVQAAPVYLDLDATVEKTCKLVDEAAANGAKVIAFPEAFIPGYPWWIWMGNPDYGMKFYIRLYKNSVEIPSPAVQKLSQAAKRNQVYFCVSVTEKDGASLYLTQLWFDPDGNLVGKHRKLKATNAEKIVWGDGDGSMFPVLETPYGNLGGLQCWEHLLPHNLSAMGALNEQVHVASWPIFVQDEAHILSWVGWDVSTKYHCLSNQVFALMSSQLWTTEMRDILAENEEQRNFMPLGGGRALIIAPNGMVISNTLPHTEEGIVYADIDLEQIIPGKCFIDPTGHYSTPGFLSLTFDRSVHKPVKIIGDDKQRVITYDEIQFTEEIKE